MIAGGSMRDYKKKVDCPRSRRFIKRRGNGAGSGSREEGGCLGRSSI